MKWVEIVISSSFLQIFYLISSPNPPPFQFTLFSLHTSIQLVVRFLGLRFSHTLARGLLLPLLLGLEGKWILAWHILYFFRQK